MIPEALSELAPEGVLRAGINLGNFLLVTGRTEDGDPVGVAPDMARAVADRLAVPVRYVTYTSPGEVADAAGTGAYDIGLIGAEPQRAEKIAFSPAYCEIEATYLVRAESRFRDVADLDAKDVRIAVMGRSAYGLWMERNIRHAELVRTENIDASWERFSRGDLDALAGLRPRLLADVEKHEGLRIIEGRFMAVQQAIGTARVNEAGASFLADFVEEAKASGLVAELIEKHGVKGLSVAPPAG